MFPKSVNLWDDAGVIYPHDPYQMSDIKLLPESYE